MKGNSFLRKPALDASKIGVSRKFGITRRERLSNLKGIFLNHSLLNMAKEKTVKKMKFVFFKTINDSMYEVDVVGI